MTINLKTILLQNWNQDTELSEWPSRQLVIKTLLLRCFHIQAPLIPNHGNRITMCYQTYAQGWCKAGTHYFGAIRPDLWLRCRDEQCPGTTKHVRVAEPWVEMCGECLAKKMEQMFVDAHAKFETEHGSGGKVDGRRRSFP